ncbi:MAG: arginine repressor [Actinomycetia bacterium]|nr:arginine repressor [Actinomycetes bacterium]
MRSTGARRRALRSLLVRGKAAEQAELAKSLAESGHVVSQSTISRDLRYLGAVKDRDGRYRLGSLNDRSDHPKDPDRRLSKAINTYAVSIEASANLVVMKTFPGAASVVASALDAALETGEIGDALGTVAGDDTVLVVATQPTGGRNVKKQLERIGEMV